MKEWERVCTCVLELERVGPRVAPSVSVGEAAESCILGRPGGDKDSGSEEGVQIEGNGKFFCCADAAEAREGDELFILPMLPPRLLLYSSILS